MTGTGRSRVVAGPGYRMGGGIHGDELTVAGVVDGPAGRVCEIVQIRLSREPSAGRPRWTPAPGTCLERELGIQHSRAKIVDVYRLPEDRHRTKPLCYREH